MKKEKKKTILKMLSVFLLCGYAFVGQTTYLEAADGPYASNPDPPNEAININTDVLLSWQPGYSEGILAHDVYIGTSLEDVNNADEFDTTGIYQGWTVEPNWPCSGLVFSTKYYWRIDEVNDRIFPGSGTIYKGDVWSFTTRPDEATMYELTVTVVSGHGTVEPNSGSYSAGTVVTLTATPEAGYYVVRQWTGTDDDTSCALTNTVTMDSDKTVTVEFGLPHIILVPGEYTTIQGAIDAAGCGDVVVLNAGVYYEDINFNGKNITVTSANPDDPNVVAYTIIQGTGTGPVVTFSGSESQSCMLDGLTITGGYTTGDGGGICGNGTEAAIANCVITNNHADGYGGGVSNCSGTIVRCTITGNTAGNGGGGIYVEDCNLTVEDCDISYNTAARGGGLFSVESTGTITSSSFCGNSGLTTTVGDPNDPNNNIIELLGRGGGYFCWSSIFAITDSIFTGNQASASGGGIYFAGNDMDLYNNPLLHNCLVTLNRAGRDGGGISVNWFAEPVISNCTIADNRVTGADSVGYGGGLYCSYGSYVEVINSIIWGNFAQQGFQVAVCSGDEYISLPSMLTISYSDVEGGPGGAYVEAGSTLDWGIGNIDIDPLFVDAASGNYHLLPDSPCIDAGDPNYVAEPNETDLDGNPRIRGSAVDMGAYESMYYHVDGVNGDNTNDGLTQETAFKTIQWGINVAEDNETVLVWPGVYNETATHGINFQGKAITIKSAADAAVLEVPGFTAVSFVQGEEENSVFSNFVVRGSSTGIFALFANPTISNVTVVNNDNGIIADNANPLISNSIFWNNTNGDLFGSPDPITAQYSFVQDEIEANLIAYYSFDNPNDPVHDDSGNGHDGTIYDPNWVTGQVGGALSFDGMDDYVDCGTSFASVTTSTTKSIIVWVKSADGMCSNILILYRRSDSGSCFSITAESTPAVWSGVYMKSATTAGLLVSESPVVVNKWTHIALVQDGTNVDIYVNGVSENNSSDAAAPTLSNPLNATIGTYFYGGPTCFFNGTIDDVRIYDRALSAEEIQAIYEAGLVGQVYGLLPLFADANNGDYHLLSERGRYRATTDEWILDKVTSPCVDGGDPSVKPSNERTPNGGRINMGAYGNTAYASMSEWPIKGDANNDGRFNFMDIAILLDGWLQELPWAQ